jgi:hypothetical protein
MAVERHQSDSNCSQGISEEIVLFLKNLGTSAQRSSLPRSLRMILWLLLLGAFVGGGVLGARATFRSPQSRVPAMSRWGTSDLMLTSTGTAYSAQSLIDALADLPEGDLILFVANSGDIGFSLAYFHTSYFAAPRRTVALRCDAAGGEGQLFNPIPSGSVRTAAVVFYAMEPPPQFSGGRRAGANLVVVPFSMSIAGRSNWKHFCQ